MIADLQARDPGRDLPGRGLHTAENHAPARQARLHPVVHLLHVANMQGGARGVLHRAHADADCGSTFARTCLPTRRTSCMAFLQEGGPPRSGSVWSSRRRSAPPTASIADSSYSRTGRRRRARRSISTPRSTSSGSGTGPSRIRSSTSSRESTRSGAAQPALQYNDTLRFHLTTDDELIAYSKIARRTAIARLFMVVSLSPSQTRKARSASRCPTTSFRTPTATTSSDLLTGSCIHLAGRMELRQAGPFASGTHLPCRSAEPTHEPSRPSIERSASGTRTPSSMSSTFVRFSTATTTASATFRG